MKRQIRLKINSKAKAVRKSLDGVEHLVVPVVAAQETVMNGLFYPKEELSAEPENWNGVPVPVNHPQVNGEHITANSPKVQEKWNAGMVYNSVWDDGKLKNEMWLNIAKLEKLGHSNIVERLENNEMIEVSTGLTCEVEPTAGIHNNIAYTGIVRNIRPDHIAILPEDEGACSIESGCGALRVNAKDKEAFVYEDEAGLKLNKLSSRQLEGQLDLLVSQANPNNKFGIWIVDIFEDFFIYEKGREFWKQGYSETNDIAKLEGDPVSVFRKTIYIEKNGNIVNKNGGIKGMDKEKVVSGIIANSKSQFEEGDKEALTAMSECTLLRLKNDLDDKKEQEDRGEAGEDTPAAEPEAEAPAGEPEAPKKETAENVLDSIKDPEIKSFMSNAIAAERKKKEDLVNSLIDSSKFSKEELRAMEINVLEKLSESIRPTANYGGQAGAELHANSGSDIQKAPAVLLANKEDKE